MVADDRDAPQAHARLPVWVRPGCRVAAVAWDPWRRRWTVSVRAPARDGRANAELVELLAQRLGVPPSNVRLVGGGSSHAKLVEVAGVDSVTAIGRLSEDSP